MSACTDTIRRVQQFYDDFDFSRALEEIWSAISWLDGFIVQQQPWKLAKSQAEGAQDQLDAVLYTAAEYIRVITALCFARPARDGASRSGSMLGMRRTRSRIHVSSTWPIRRCRRGRRLSRSRRCSRASKPNQAIEKMQELEAERHGARRRCSGRRLPRNAERRVRRIDGFSRVAAANNGPAIGRPPARDGNHHR